MLLNSTKMIARVARSRLSRFCRVREYNFASSRYNECFGNVPLVDVQALREDALEAIKEREKYPDLWYEDPVVTILNGNTLRDGHLENTVDSFGRENGRIILATDDEIEKIEKHLRSFESKGDYREAIRKVEKEILTKYAGKLIANQAADFKKQDGVTEIEESLEANAIERRMNDALLEDEKEGIVNISREPVFVGCVSNFSNFLDLCRKVLRHLELGVPCVVLSRSNTTQHMYRWVQILVELMAKHNVDEGLLTYASCTIPQTQRLFDAFPDGPMHITCSREVAENVRSCHANTLSSTGGPNTLVATECTPEVLQAIRWSAMIENSGQCTALRHAVVNADEATVRSIFDESRAIESSQDSLSNGEFANLFRSHPFEALEGYHIHRPKSHGEPCAYRVSDELPPDGVSEQWRQVYVDVTSPKEKVGSDEAFVEDVAKWLVRNQPISLAVNGSYDMALKLFEQTSQVVYTIGGTKEHVALTAQARPQDGEVFGEFPVRKEMHKYTKYPMIVPSPPAAYNSVYGESYLAELESSSNPVAIEISDHVESNVVKGYIKLMHDYLVDACGVHVGWRTGDENFRTALYGIQRPPLNGTTTVVRCDSDTSFDMIAPVLLPFMSTNAKDQFEVSVDPQNERILSILSSLGSNINVKKQTRNDFEKTISDPVYYNVIESSRVPTLETTGLPLVGQYLSLWFPMGHVKSAKPNDQEFIKKFEASEKWLSVM